MAIIIDIVVVIGLLYHGYTVTVGKYDDDDDDDDGCLQYKGSLWIFPLKYNDLRLSMKCGRINLFGLTTKKSFSSRAPIWI